MNLPLEHIFIPSQVPSEKLMVVLHGRGDSAEGFTFLPEQLRIDEMNYLLLNAPERYYTGYSWYDLPPNQLSGIERSRELLTQTLDALFANGYSPEETYLFGFSQGSLLTLEFGARYGRALAGYIGISGYIYDAPRILKEMNPDVNADNWLVTHGTHDDVLDVRTTRAQVAMLKEGGFNIDYREYRKTHTVLPEELDDIREWIAERF